MRSSDLRSDNIVTYLVDGRRTFEAMHRAILTAVGSEHYIYLLGWWLSDDFPIVRPSPGASVTIRELLSDASRRGVQVRAMLWDQLGRQNSEQVGRINALTNGAAILDNETFHRLVGSHHQKVLIVKGSEGLIAFCGGVDINRDRIVATGGGGSSSSGGAGSPLHDVHCRIIGPSAHDLLMTFIQRWDHHPDHARLDRTKGALRGRSESRPAPIPRRRLSPTEGHCAVRIARTFNPVHRSSNPMVRRERTIQVTLEHAIRNAQRFIYMEDQYLVSMHAADLLNRALPRIQHLTILIPHSSITDMPRRWEGRLNFIRRLSRGSHGHKVRVFFLSTPPNTPGTPARFGRHTYVHSKIWIIDDELAVIGSANCNRRGWESDSEVNAVIFESENPTGLTFAQKLRMRLWAEHLNIGVSRLRDGVGSAALWLSPPTGARVRPYNARGGSDPVRDSLIPWSVIDPAGP